MIRASKTGRISLPVAVGKKGSQQIEKKISVIVRKSGEPINRETLVDSSGYSIVNFVSISLGNISLKGSFLIDSKNVCVHSILQFSWRYFY